MITKPKLKQTDLWEVKIFGALEVQKPTGEHIPLNGRKAGELLAYLALNPNQAHSRQKLTTLLWADSEISNERTRLRQEIFFIRSLFPADGEANPLVHISQAELQIGPEVKIDAISFLDLIGRLKKESDVAVKISLMEEALELYKGDLLEDYDTAWIVAERERISQLCEKLLFDLAREYRSQKRFEAEEQILRRILTRDNTNEECQVDLMRLYADMGQPNKVQQQFQALERALLQEYGSIPSEGMRNLAKSLQERAVEKSLPSTSPIAPRSNDMHALVSNSFVSGPVSEPVSIQTSHPVISYRTNSPRRQLLLVFSIILVLALTVGIWQWKHYPTPPVSTFHSKWTYLYQPGAGEKMNSEGYAIAYTHNGIYITGLIDTDKEDIDFLIVKLFPNGKEQWHRRYSSPEHDCDRSYSVCADDAGAYILGETSVPGKHGVTEGWYMTLVYYDEYGRRRWVERSKLPVQNEMQHMQVVLDGQNGCYVGCTAVVKGKQSIYVMHYSRKGKLIWGKTFVEGSESIFSHMAAYPRDGTLFICGKARKLKSDGTVNDDGLVLRIENTGKKKWSYPLDGPVNGGDESNNIVLDSGQNVLVSGIYDTGSPALGGNGIELGLDKFSYSGTHLWHSLVKSTGPKVQQYGLSCNVHGDLAMGGTETLPDGSKNIVLCWYLGNGDITRTWRYPIPKPYHSSEMNTVHLGGDSRALLIGQISNTVQDFPSDSSILAAKCNSEGHIEDQSIFTASKSHPRNYSTGSCEYGSGYLVTGQASPKNAGGTLMVNYFDWDNP